MADKWAVLPNITDYREVMAAAEALFGLGGRPSRWPGASATSLAVAATLGNTARCCRVEIVGTELTREEPDPWL
jgi:hypothetical protein